MKMFSVIPEPSLPPWHPSRIRILDGSAYFPTEDQRSEETVGNSLLSTTMSPPLTASDITLDTGELEIRRVILIKLILNEPPTSLQGIQVVSS